MVRRSVVVLFLPLFLVCLLGVATGAFSWWPFGSSERELKQWAGQYCQVASGFVSGFMAPAAQPSGPWEASMAFINHYRRTDEAAETAVGRLTAMKVPDEVRNLQMTTVGVLGSVRSAARDGIRDVEHASNRALFAAATERYRKRLRDGADRLESTTREAPPVVRQELQRCTVDLLR